MHMVASNVPCYMQSDFGCDFWEATIDAGSMGTVYYRFIVHDGPKTVYYEDDSDVRDGGWGKPFDSSPDWGWALTVYDPNFKPIDWLKNAVIYQIFPDRFRNANTKNDPARGNPKKYVWSKDKRYAYPHGDPCHESTPALDRIMRMPWGSMPEGWCRNYTDALQSCKKRFGPDKNVGTEGPHGRDYFGGDLAGITQKMAYLKSLGVTVVYMNPIFWAGSNHRYDTRDYTKIDPYLGKQADFVKLVKAAHKNGIKVLLDGVFNHMSSDSPMFDRYHNWPGTGACEQTFSKYRGFFFFRKPAAGEPSPCAGGQAGETLLRVLVRLRLAAEADRSLRRQAVRLRHAAVGGAEVAQARRRRLAPGRHAGQVGRLLARLQGRGRQDEGERADRRRVVEEVRRPAVRLRRHRDLVHELPLPRRRRVAACAAPVRLEGLPRQRQPDPAVAVRQPHGVDPRGLPRRRVLDADEPRRLARHRAHPLDAHAGRRERGAARAQRGQPGRGQGSG